MASPPPVTGQSASTASPTVTVAVSSKCPICFDAVSNGYRLSCGHAYCRGCLLAWLTNRVKDKEVVFACFADARTNTGGGERRGVGSPLAGLLVCKRPIPDADLVNILAGTDGYDRLVRFRRTLADPSLRDCPFGCRVLVPGTPTAPDLTCPQCSQPFCFIHANAHAGRACEVYAAERGSQERADEALALRDTKRCPKCAVPTEKRDGCNSVRCALCRASWCWLCGKEVDSSELPTHFQWWNLGGCANKQFADGSESRWQKLLTYLYFGLVGVPSFLITGLVYAACCCVCIPASCAWEQGPRAFFMTMTSLVSLALAAFVIAGIVGPLLVPFAILYGVVVLACLPCYVAGRQRRAAATAAAAAGSTRGSGGGGVAPSVPPSPARSSASNDSRTPLSTTALVMRTPTAPPHEVGVGGGGDAPPSSPSSGGTTAVSVVVVGAGEEGGRAPGRRRASSRAPPRGSSSGTPRSRRRTASGAQADDLDEVRLDVGGSPAAQHHGSRRPSARAVGGSSSGADG